MSNQRLHGLDLARYLALIGMVIVNFDVVMVQDNSIVNGSSALAKALQGRAAAVFVVLAGIGLGIAASRSAWHEAVTVTLKRAAFLLALGLINTLIFSADIIHYYAVYFLFGVLMIRATDRLLWFAIVGLVVGFVFLAGVFDYERAWNWQTLTYADFWTLKGFVRNLLFNGWHPVVPWLAYLLFGIWISRQDLKTTAVQAKFAIAGAAVLATTLFAAHWITVGFSAGDAGLAILVATDPVPPMPLYMLAGGSTACLVIGLCLLVSPALRAAGILAVFTPAGRQTLTLYIAHILIGMGLLEALDRIGGQSGQAALIAASLFCVAATVFALVWSRYFTRGPLEALMRFISR